MTISKEHIEFVLKEARECLKYASYDKSFWKTVITVLKDRLSEPKPSEALAALEIFNKSRIIGLVKFGYQTYEIKTSDADKIRAALQRNAVPQGFVLVPIEPTEQHLVSMAYRYDHSFGIDKDNSPPLQIGHDENSRRAIITRMRQLYEEVVSPSWRAAAPKQSGE